MENKRKALGKGLEQLFSNERIDFENFEQTIVEEAKQNDIVEIPLVNIRSNPYQPREYFDEQALKAYQEDTMEETAHYGSVLSLTLPLFEPLKDSPKMQEYFYELELSKKYFPRAFEEVEEIREDMKRLNIGQFKMHKLTDNK